MWGRRPPKQPSTIVHVDTAPPSIRPTKRPRKKTTKVRQEQSKESSKRNFSGPWRDRSSGWVDQRDDRARWDNDKINKWTGEWVGTRSEDQQLLRSENLNYPFQQNSIESEESTTHPHDDVRIHGRTPGRKIRGRKGQHKRVNTSHFIVSGESWWWVGPSG